MTIFPSKRPCPCHGCKDRTADPNCHGASGNCPHGYQDWLMEREKQKEKARKEHQAESDIAGHFVENVGKIAKRNKRSWKR